MIDLVSSTVYAFQYLSILQVTVVTKLTVGMALAHNSTRWQRIHSERESRRKILIQIISALCSTESSSFLKFLFVLLFNLFKPPWLHPVFNLIFLPYNKTSYISYILHLMHLNLKSLTPHALNAVIHSTHIFLSEIKSSNLSYRAIFLSWEQQVNCPSV